MPRPPSNGRVTSSFGIRVAPVPGASTFHQGEDTIGSGNWAPVTGTVVFAGYYGSWGNVVGIRQRSDSAVIWWVAHHASISVGMGEIVREGATFLGPMGRTGNVSGTHAHTERRVGGSARPGTGNATNPRLYYTAAAGGDEELIEKKETTMLIIVNNETAARSLLVEGCYPYTISKDTSDVYTTDLGVLAKSTTGARYAMVLAQQTEIAQKANAVALTAEQVAAIARGVVVPPPVLTDATISAIAQKVIDFQKLPGN